MYEGSVVQFVLNDEVQLRVSQEQESNRIPSNNNPTKLRLSITTRQHVSVFSQCNVLLCFSLTFVQVESRCIIFG